MKNFRLFKNVVCNCILGLVIVSVLAVSVASGIIPTSNTLKPTSKGVNPNSVGLMVGVNGNFSEEYLHSMLNLLDKSSVTATFFVGGAWASMHEETLKKIHSCGHEIGNLGYFDIDHKTLSQHRSAEEISITHKLIKNILGVDMTLFTPPSSSYSSGTLLAADSLKYKTIIPTNDTMDLKDKDKTLIFNRAVKNLSGGTLILIHPTFEAIDALGDIMRYVAGKGYQLGTVTSALDVEII